MKQYFFIFSAIFAVAIAVFSCKKNSSSNNQVFVLGDTLAMPYGQPINIFPNTTYSFTASLNSIVESRCPVNALCIWAGTVDATLLIEKNSPLLLHLRQPKDTTINQRLYRFELTNVTPYPIIGNTPSIENYTAFVKISYP